MIIWSLLIKIISDHNNPVIQLLSQHQSHALFDWPSQFKIRRVFRKPSYCNGMPRTEGMKANCRRPSSRYYAQSCSWAGRTVGHCSFGEHCNGPGDQNYFHVHRDPAVEVFHTFVTCNELSGILHPTDFVTNAKIQDRWTWLQKRVNCIILLIKCFGDPCKPWKSHKNEEAVQRPCVLNPGRIQNRQQWGVGST